MIEPQPLEEVVRNVNERLGRVEQILPTLATKAELHAAIAEAVAPLATKAELRETRSELREDMPKEGEHTRQHFDVVAERLEGHIRLVAEGQLLLQERFDHLRADLKADIAQLDRRVMRLETRITVPKPAKLALRSRLRREVERLGVSRDFDNR